MKYTIEIIDDNTVKETLQIENDKFESISTRTDSGCRTIGKGIQEQLAEQWFNEEFMERYEDTFGGFAALNFLKLNELK